MTPRTSTTSNILLLILLILYRLLTSLTIQSYFIADEFWQAYEIAFHKVYGYGYLTWEWIYKLRNFAYPWMLVMHFEIAKKMELGWEWTLFLPKITLSILSGIADYYTILLAVKLFDKRIRKYIIFITVFSWFNLFLSTRMIPNNLEGMLTIIALYYWPLDKMDNNWNFEFSLVLAAITCILRPTAALLWVYLGLCLFFNNINYWKRIFLSTGIIMILSISLMIYIDYLYYSEWVLIPYNFFNFNVNKNIASHYGTSQWYYYPLIGIPILLGPFLLILIYSFTLNNNVNNNINVKLIKMISAVIIGYSFLQHKEARFLYQIHYILLIVIAKQLQFIQLSKKWYIILMVLNLSLGTFFNGFHQTGVIKVMNYLRNNKEVNSIGFLMPCHSTPYYSHLNKPTPMWFITCNPPLSDNELIEYKKNGYHSDVSDHFYDDVYKFIINNFQDEIDLNMNYTIMDASKQYTYFWPSHLVMFEDLINSHPKVLSLFIKKGYNLCYSTFNSYWHDDARRKGNVLVYCK